MLTRAEIEWFGSFTRCVDCGSADTPFFAQRIWPDRRERPRPLCVEHARKRFPWCKAIAEYETTGGLA
jgi:hypothetical protein